MSENEMTYENREDVEKLKGELERLREELARTREELVRAKELSEKYLSGWQYAQADLENYKKRVQQEREELSSLVIEGLVLRILPVYDSLERALMLGGGDQEQSPVFEGVRKVRKQFLEVLQREGIEPVEALGKPFDPEYHEAIMRVERDDCEENTVLEEVTKGFRTKRRVLRPSLVKVSCKPASDGESGDGAPVDKDSVANPCLNQEGQ